MNLITADDLAELGISEEWLEPLNDTFVRFEINTPHKQAAFIGQCQHESDNFKTLEENLNYSAEGLMRTWPSRFPDENTANKYARNPEKIANKVYAGRMGNGNEESGDGWAYHGRGLIQLTGKDNYTLCGDALTMDLINDPSKLTTPQVACFSAGWFWRKHGLNDLAESAQYDVMTKRINGGTLGLDDRIAKINAALNALA
jgi:putative chitinase